MLKNRYFSGQVVCSAKYRLDLRRQHTEIERLRNKIISSHIHSHDNVHIISRRRNKNYRYVRYFPNLAAPVVPVVKWQSNVHKNKMRVKFRKSFKYVFKILNVLRVVSPHLHLFLDCLRHCQIVFNNQYFIHAAAPFIRLFSVKDLHHQISVSACRKSCFLIKSRHQFLVLRRTCITKRSKIITCRSID